jgi:hypothetical protein
VSCDALRACKNRPSGGEYPQRGLLVITADLWPGDPVRPQGGRDLRAETSPTP